MENTKIQNILSVRVPFDTIYKESLAWIKKEFTDYQDPYNPCGTFTCELNITEIIDKWSDLVEITPEMIIDIEKLVNAIYSNYMINQPYVSTNYYKMLTDIMDYLMFMDIDMMSYIDINDAEVDDDDYNDLDHDDYLERNNALEAHLHMGRRAVSHRNGARTRYIGMGMYVPRKWKGAMPKIRDYGY